MSMLKGRRILLVEDESLVALLAESMLEELGCQVLLAMRLEHALTLATSGEFALAMLDVNLGEERSYPIADILHARGIPFLFATGYDQSGLLPHYRHVPTIQKPFRENELAESLTALLTAARPVI